MQSFRTGIDNYQLIAFDAGEFNKITDGIYDSGVVALQILVNGKKHIQIHYNSKNEYVQVSEIKEDVISIDWVYDNRSKSKDFYAI